ncbi:MAG: LPS assembly lipoprotein LptE [Bacteroidota bacterium]
MNWSKFRQFSADSNSASADGLNGENRTGIPTGCPGIRGLTGSLSRAGIWALTLVLLSVGGCVSYSFTGASIPSDVRTVHIPFFDDQSGGGVADLSDQLNRALIQRFVNQSRLSQTGEQQGADAWVEGQIVSYQIRSSSIGGDQQANLNEVTITVRAVFQYADEDEPLYSKNFSGSGTYDVQESPVDGETAAAAQALQQIANNMFNDAVSNW